MRERLQHVSWKPVITALVAVLVLASSALAQQAPDASAAHEKKAGPVVRVFGTEGGYRTEVTSETHGTLSQEDRRQVSLLAAQVFQHVDEARRALDADDTTLAGREVAKGRDALKAARALLPRTTVRTRTTAPDGKVIYEDERDVQDDRVSLYEGMIQARTLAPILEARRDATEVAGVRVLESEAFSTEVTADLDFIEAQLTKAAKALDARKSDEASKALASAQVRGVDLHFSKEDTPLAEARDAIWLARRSLEENNVTQARVNLDLARRRLRLYREVAPEERRADVDRMLKESDQLEAQLRQETGQPATPAERTRQGNVVTQWWDQVNRWFRRHF